MTSEVVPMQYFSKCQSEFKPPLIANENAYLGDVATRYYSPNLPTLSTTLTRIRSEHNDPEKPIVGGFYRLEKGTPLEYTYTYHEMKIIVEGSFDITDETGKTVHAVPGDVFYFPKGAKIKFTTEDYGLAFFSGQRKTGGA